MKNTLTTIILATIIALSITTIFAAPGDLDTTFGGDGRVFNAFGNATETMADFAMQPDGKMVAVTNGLNQRDILLVRYNANGTLDSSFGVGIFGSYFGEAGKVIVDFGGSERATALAIQADGKIVVVGSSTGPINSSQNFTAIFRFNSNGSVDTSFGINGLLLADLEPGIESAKDVEIHAEGEIVVTTGFHVVRYTVDGVLDTSFDSDGIVSSTATKLEIQHNVSPERIWAIGPSIAYRYNISGGLDTTFDGDGIKPLQAGIDLALKLQPDGKILIGGFITDGLDEDFALTRFLNNGGVDLTFGSDGLVTIDISLFQRSTRISDISLQSDGKIIAVGTPDITRLPDGTDLAVPGYRFNPNGSLDAAITYLNSMVRVSSNFVESQPDGKIIVAGSTPSLNPVGANFASNDFSIARFNSDGISFDSSFGNNGIETKELIGLGTANDVKFQPDGKMLVAGTVFDDRDESPFVARYNSDGSLDSTFDSDGISIANPIFTFYPRGSSLAIQSDGKILIAGPLRTLQVGPSDFGIIRLNQDGTIDFTFGISRFTAIPVGTQNDIPFSVLVQPDGKILVGGAAQGLGYAVVRLNSDGTLDTTFDSDGKATFGLVNPGSDTNQTFKISMFLQPDGKIILSGMAADLTTIRINSNGTLDSSFGSSGIATAPGQTVGKAAFLQPDGKILVTGNVGNPPAIAVTARYNANGTLDTSFGTGGISTIPSGLPKFVTSSMALQADGKIILGGETIPSGSNNSDLAVIRLLPNGSLENSLWGTGGIVTTNLGNNDFLNAIGIQPDGKIVAVGRSGLSTVAVVRYQALAPTAATATINGRVTTASGRSIRNVSLSLTDTTTGESKSTITNPFGYYHFQDLEVGRSYVLSVKSKRFTFAEPSRLITLDEDLTGEDFIADEK
jgi:uncharacterized delta-60 repeat protein